MRDKDQKLIYEAYTEESPISGTITFADKNQKGRRIPRLATIGDTSASLDMIGLDKSAAEVKFYEVGIEWSWYGGYYGQTETSPGEEPQTEDLHVVRVIDVTEPSAKDVSDNKPLVDVIQDVVRGELEGATVSLMTAYGWEMDDSY